MQNLVEEHSPPREKTPADMLALVEWYRQELGLDDSRINMTQAARYEQLYRRLLFSGKFTPLTAANAIFDLKEKRNNNKK